MFKKFLALFCILLIVFSAVSCTGKKAADAKDETISTPYFWKVSGNGFDGEFYLLGSIHAGDENTNKYPDEITDAYNKCDNLAVESDVIALESDMGIQMQLSLGVMYRDGSLIDAHIDGKVYEAACDILRENELYFATMDMFKPVYWSMLIENIVILKSDYTTDNGVDRFFLTKAKDEDKNILEIEDAVETYNALGALSESTQKLLLEQATLPEYIDESIKALGEQYSVWKKGDVTGFEEYFEFGSTEGMSEAEISAVREYYDMLITTRNKNMIKTADSYLKNGKNVFYIVGLAHFLGENNIIDGLTDLGYTVTRVEYK